MSIKFTNLPVVPMRITSKFGKRNTGIKGASTEHKGIDFGRNKSISRTSVLCVADGIVESNYWNDYRGWVVIIRHNGYKTLYQHLESKSALVVGSQISSASIIGIMGNSSDANVLKVATHLHFELRVNDIPIDPQEYLDKCEKLCILAQKFKLKYSLSNDTIEYLKDYEYAESLFTGLISDKKDFSIETINYIMKYKYGTDLIKKLGAY